MVVYCIGQTSRMKICIAWKEIILILEVPRPPLPYHETAELRPS
jgi:hypothetical protein